MPLTIQYGLAFKRQRDAKIVWHDWKMDLLKMWKTQTAIANSDLLL